MSNVREDEGFSEAEASSSSSSVVERAVVPVRQVCGCNGSATLKVGSEGKLIVEDWSALMSWSSYFRAKFAEKITNTFEFPQFHPLAVRWTLQFMRTKRIMVHCCGIVDTLRILNVSKFFGAEKVVDECRAHIQGRVKAENAVEIFRTVTNYADEQLKLFICNYISRNVRAIFLSPSFLKLTEVELCTLLNMDEWFLEEERVFDHVKRWGQHQLIRGGRANLSLKEVMGQAFYSVRFPLMKKEHFYKNIYDKNVELFFGKDLQELAKFFITKNKNDLEVFNCRPRCITID